MKIRKLLMLIMLFMACSGLFVSGMISKSDELSHEKATQEDVVTSTNAPAGALKGVQGTDFSDKFKYSAKDLNMNAMFLNCDISWFVNTNGVGTKVYTMSDGTSYYIDDVTEGGMLKVIDIRIKQFRAQGVTWNLCLMMGWTDINGNHDKGMEKLMYNPQQGHYYYSWNVTNEESEKALRAIVDYLTERYSYKDTFVQNWWINNEVNVLNDKIYTVDALDENIVMNIAIKGYDLLYDSLKQNNPSALAYVSVTHDWNNTNEGKGLSTREFISKFAKAESNKDWNIDLHAYPPQMKEQVWSKASSAYLRMDEDTVSVCAANLDIFVNYIKNNFGSNHRIIMSEQGFDSTVNSKHDAETEQAIMMAYTYLAAARNEMIDEVIFTAFYDTESAGHDFYDMGVIDSSGRKKKSFEVFKYMNTDKADEYLNPYLSSLNEFVYAANNGAKSVKTWSDNVLYEPPKTNDQLQAVALYLPKKEQTVANTIMIGIDSNPKKTQIDIEYRWKVFDYSTNTLTEVQGWKLNGEWIRWSVPHNGSYEFYGTARVAGNTSSMMTAHMTVTYNGSPISTDMSSGWFNTIDKEDDKQNPTGEFIDVEAGSWYAEAVKWAKDKNITVGTSKNTFGPKDNCTRAQVVTFLWRACGSPEPNSLNSPFSDVTNSKAYYYKAVMWAVEQGITKGTSETTFSPEQEVKRSEFVTFMWRAKGKEVVDGKSDFSDVADSNAYYYNAVMWAVKNGITTGTSKNTFAPSEICNRAQVVTFLYRGYK